MLQNLINDIRDEMARHKSTEIARASGLHVNTVRRIRNGLTSSPDTDTLIKIHNALNALDIIQAAEDLK